MDQSKNEVHGNLAGRDVNITHVGAERETFMVRLHKKFEMERANSVTFRETIDALQYFQDSVDIVPMGLEKKLELAGRQMDIPQALRAKELFVKCIARYSLSESAQTVIAYCLGKIHELFKANVSPLIGQRGIGADNRRRCIYNRHSAGSRRTRGEFSRSHASRVEGHGLLPHRQLFH